MGEATYRQGTWAGMAHYVCLVPGEGGLLHGWDTTDLDRMTQHLAEVHGAEAMAEEEDVSKMDQAEQREE